MTGQEDREGVGCGLVAVALAAFVVFAAVMVTSGLLATNFSLIFAALPVSAFLTALGGEFVLAWPVDGIAWIVLAFGSASLAERRHVRVASVVLAVIGLALVYGVLMGLLVEPSGEFFGR